ncbi:DUF58 domain-containing protein [Alteribacter natronophilus]|uniref:DUF58 domain-containing protein n=1 Tax=Alteribacter natronophilus TaxID=2583810 RepID=UPI00110EA830|nr:DUF58 domain-containing protein [Alteribacter natronophilus]TMW71836.1 DUF58 domain-containing protein [Alteribacter natronophilus]
MTAEWQIEPRHAKIYTVLLSIVPFLLVTALIISDLLLASLGVFIILFILINRLYLRYLSANLTVPYEHQVIRLFPGEDGFLSIPFTNKSRLPLVNGTWGCHLYDHEEALGKSKDDGHIPADPSSYKLNLSIPARTARRFNVPVTAVKRGAVQVRSIEAVIYDPFRLSFVRMRYQGPFHADAVVYPEPSSVPSLRTFHLQEKGHHSRPYSLYEDTTMPRGTRPYGSTDPFNRLNWKATARTGEIQTKVYEQVTLSKWTLVLNIRDDAATSRTLADLESVLSQAAFAIRFALKHGIRFDLFINVRLPGAGMGLSLQADEGRKHAMRALEILARLRHGQITIDDNRFMQRVVRSGTGAPTTFIHFGTYGYSGRFYYERAERAGHQTIIVPLKGGRPDEAMAT